jgi:hypothetical protein
MNLRKVLWIAAVLVGSAALVSILCLVRWRPGFEAVRAVASGFLLAIPFIAFFIFWHWLYFGRASAILGRWAETHGYEILQRKRPFLTGAFSFWNTSRGQVIYFLTLRDQSGHERSCWVRCGSFFGGVLFSDDIEVKWCDPQPKAA